MATEHPSVTILILNWNGRQVVPRCLSALEALDYPDLRIVVADNGSADDSLAYIRDNHPQVEVIELGHNMGFARGNNAGFARLAHKSDLLVLLNTDVYVRPGWLTALVQPFSRPDTGVSGAKLLFLDEKHIQHAGGEMGYPLAISRHIGYQELDDGQPEDEQEVPYVTGASLAIRWSLAQELGLFDEQFAPYYYEEADLCARVWQAGYKVIYVPQA
ncbi:MAG: glycosyltransferase family 2 protein, partial [Chloroflexota bacterium]